MNESRTYLASDLAAELGVPRTTVNDWLARYAPYLETELRGKRRAYTEGSLAILREVLALRNEGRAAVEIEAELAKRHGIRPEIAPAAENAAAAATEAVPGTELAARVTETVPARIASDDLEKLFAAFKEQETMRAAAMRRFRISLVLLVLGLLVALGIPLIWLFGRVLADLRTARTENTVRYQAVETRNSDLARKLDETGAAVQHFHKESASKLDLAATRAAAAAEAAAKSADAADKIRRAQELELAKIAVALDKYQQNYQAAVAKLKAEYEQNKQLRDRELERLSADKDKFAEAERIRLKEEFAARQKAELEKIEREFKSRLEDARKLAETRQAELEKSLAAERAKRAAAETAAADARKQVLSALRQSAMKPAAKPTPKNQPLDVVAPAPEKKTQDAAKPASSK